MFPRIRLVAVLSVAAGLLAAAGCGSEDSGSKAGATSTKVDSAIPASLAGTYERTVTPADVARTKSFRQEGPHQEPLKPGHNTMVIAEGAPQGTVTVTDPIGTTGMDALASSDGVLRLTSYTNPAEGAYCGPWIPAPGHYTWKLNGTTLVLTANADPCADRDSALTGRWSRK